MQVELRKTSVQAAQQFSARTSPRPPTVKFTGSALPLRKWNGARGPRRCSITSPHHERRIASRYQTARKLQRKLARRRTDRAAQPVDSRVPVDNPPVYPRPGEPKRGQQCREESYAALARRVERSPVTAKKTTRVSLKPCYSCGNATVSRDLSGE